MKVSHRRKLNPDFVHAVQRYAPARLALEQLSLQAGFSYNKVYNIIGEQYISVSTGTIEKLKRVAEIVGLSGDDVFIRGTYDRDDEEPFDFKKMAELGGITKEYDGPPPPPPRGDPIEDFPIFGVPSPPKRTLREELTLKIEQWTDSAVRLETGQDRCDKARAFVYRSVVSQLKAALEYHTD